MQFVYQYPLANALASHLDVAIQNRLSAHFFGESIVEVKNPWPFRLTPVERDVDEYLFDRLRYLNRRTATYTDMLASVPLAIHRDLRDLAQLPDTVATRQITWALDLARAPLLRFLVRLDYDAGGQRNTHTMRYLKRSLRAMAYDRDMMVALPPGRYDQVLDWLSSEIGAYL